CEEIFESHDEKPTSSFLYSLVMDSYSMGYSTSSFIDMPLNHKVFLAQFDTIKHLADTESCVIVGRCADYILKDNPNCYNVFLFADTDKKLDFCLKEYHEAHDVAFEKMQQIDKRRAEHYLHYTGKNIKDPHNYQLCVDVGTLGLNNSCDLICDLAKTKLNPSKSA
ncbi:AAA family ATPase, partial [uncultured Succinatimonas sp.]|uniref:cytidylate kinase-like family protein n=1 Tax=uncultured Succinatimonas sp. TaxID=1262973 RepID=UPI0025D15B57